MNSPALTSPAHEHGRQCVTCGLRWSQECACNDPDWSMMTLCWRCKELTAEGLAARYSFGWPILSAALALAAVAIYVFWPFRSATIETVLWVLLGVVWLALLGGFVAAFAAFILLRWFHRLRMWWEGWK